MLFNILIVLAILMVVYFHHLQGLFSATMSALLVIVSALLAVSYHEPLVAALSQGRFADYAHSITLIAIFALVYLFLRWLFDKWVPGNVIVPVWVDRVGAAAMGLVAGVYATGLIALAAHSLPFGPSIMGYSRLPLMEERSVQLPPRRGAQKLDALVYDELEADTLEGPQRPLWVPVDEILLRTVARLSDGGSLAGQRALATIHPDYLKELSGQRLGIQLGAKHTMMNVGAKKQMEVQGVYRLGSADVTDAEATQVRASRPVPPVYKSEGGTVLLVVRVMFQKGAADQSDFLVRLSPASVRLVANRKNYFPIGTLEDRRIYSNKADDPLFIDLSSEDRGADFVFLVDGYDVVHDFANVVNPADLKVAEGTFLEVKRLARQDLSGRPIETQIFSSPQVAILRKPAVKNRVLEAEAKAPLAYLGLKSTTRFLPLSVPTQDTDASNVPIRSGSVSIKSRRLARVSINADEPLAKIQEGGHHVSELYVPPEMRIIQLSVAPATGEKDPWAWSTVVGRFELIDAQGKRYRPSGAWAKLNDQGIEKLVARYDASSTLSAIEKPKSGTPGEIVLVFLIPPKTQLRMLSFEGKPVRPLDETAR